MTVFRNKLQSLFGSSAWKHPVKIAWVLAHNQSSNIESMSLLQDGTILAEMHTSCV